MRVNQVEDAVYRPELFVCTKSALVKQITAHGTMFTRFYKRSTLTSVADNAISLGLSVLPAPKWDN